MLSKSLAGLFLVGGFVFMVGCGEKIEPGTTQRQPPKTVQAVVTEAVVSTQPFIYDAVGTVAPQTASTLSSKLMGTVNEVKVKVGDRVKKGETLVVIDKRQATARLNQAEGALSEASRGFDAAVSAQEAAKSNADLARATFQRYQSLMTEESVSKQEFDEVKARYDQAASNLKQTEAMVAAARFRVQQAKAGLDSARVSRKDVTVTAPYDGVVTAKLVDVGDLASPGTPFIRLETTGLYEVQLVLPEAYIDAVRQGQKVQVRIAAIGNDALEGRVETIAPSADLRSRTFNLKVYLGEVKNIRSGMFARVAIPVGEAGIMLIPRSALIHQGQLTGLFVVDEEQIAHFRLIRNGRAIADGVEVISGLKEGQRYVVKPPPGMITGAKVEVAS